MKFFVYEIACAGGLGEPMATALTTEGWAMLSAVAGDLARLPGSEVTVLLTETCSEIPGVRCQRRDDRAERQQFEALVAEHDAVLVIGPESEKLLAQRCEVVVSMRKHLLGCGLAAIEMTGDKLRLASHWREIGLPTPRTELAGNELHVSCPAVVKPRDGAGSQATRLVRNRDEWPEIWRQVRADGGGSEFVVQSFCPGLACSVGFLIGSAQTIPLEPGEQMLSRDGFFHYLGGRMPLPPAQKDRARALALRGLHDIPELRGYVGVDLVLGDSPDGKEDYLIEINPRLTTSYIGLRRLARDNLADIWIRLLQGMAGLTITWKSGEIRFAADGTESLGGGGADLAVGP